MYGLSLGTRKTVRKNRPTLYYSTNSKKCLQSCLLGVDNPWCPCISTDAKWFLFNPWELKVLCSQELSGCIKQIVLLESKIHILFQQNTKEIKEDISIVKLKISSLQKAIILQDKFTETLKNRSSVYYSIKIILWMLWCQNSLKLTSIILSLQCTTYLWEHRLAVNWRFFYLQKGKVYYSTQLIMNCLH